MECQDKKNKLEQKPEVWEVRSSMGVSSPTPPEEALKRAEGEAPAYVPLVSNFPAGWEASSQPAEPFSPLPVEEEPIPPVEPQEVVIEGKAQPPAYVPLVSNFPAQAFSSPEAGEKTASPLPTPPVQGFSSPPAAQTEPSWLDEDEGVDERQADEEKWPSGFRPILEGYDELLDEEEARYREKKAREEAEERARLEAEQAQKKKYYQKPQYKPIFSNLVD